MELLMKRVFLFFGSFILLLSLEAVDNKLFQIIELIKKRNPSTCSIASFRESYDSFKVSCVDIYLNKYLFSVPFTVDLKSSFVIDENRLMDINDGMDSVYLAGQFQGRAIKAKDPQEIDKKDLNKLDQFDPPLLVQNQTSLSLLDNETARELGPSFRVVVDYIKNSEHDIGTYTTRIIDCQNNTFVNISKGSSVIEMEQNYGPPGGLNPIAKNSILYQLREKICGKTDEFDAKIIDILDEK